MQATKLVFLLAVVLSLVIDGLIEHHQCLEHCTNLAKYGEPRLM